MAMKKHHLCCLTLLLLLLGLASGQVLFQGFNWESSKQSGGWYSLLMGKVDDIAAAGVTHVWLPPPSHSVSPQGLSLLPDLSLPVALVSTSRTRREQQYNEEES
jgi:hypothetical protein